MHNSIWKCVQDELVWDNVDSILFRDLGRGGYFRFLDIINLSIHIPYFIDDITFSVRDYIKEMNNRTP